MGKGRQAVPIELLAGTLRFARPTMITNPVIEQASHAPSNKMAQANRFGRRVQ